MLYCRFCHPIGLMVIGFRKRVLKFVVLSKTVELIGPELGALIGDQLVWNSISGHVSFELQDHRLCRCVVQPVNFKEIRKVADCHEVTLLLVLKEICSYLRPRAIGYGVVDEGFFGLLWRKLRTDIASGDVVFYFTLHVWPVEGFSCPS